MKSFRTGVKIKESRKSDPFFGIAIGGNWGDEDPDTKEQFNSTQTKIRYANWTHDKIAEELVYEYLENEWASFFIDAVVNWLFTGFEFYGSGAEKANEFFDKTNPTSREEFRMAGWSTIVDGNGFLFKYIKGGKLFQIKFVSHINFELNFNAVKDVYTSGEKEEYGDPDDDNGEMRYIEVKYAPRVTANGDGKINGGSDKTYFFRQYPRYTLSDYMNEELVLLQLEREHDGPNGKALARSSLHGLKSLKEINRNVPAAMKRNLSSILAMYLDTSNMKDGEKRKLATEYSKKLSQLNSATIGGIAVDIKNKIGYIGGLDGSTPMGDGRMLNAIQYIEPILSAVLLNFMIPLGIVEQTGANKSLIARQEVFARKQLKDLQDRISVNIKTQILQHIDGTQNIEIRWKPFLEAETVIALYESGIITREYATKYLDIVDTENGHYATEDAIELAKTSPPQPIQTGIKKSDDSNDDNIKKKRETKVS